MRVEWFSYLKHRSKLFKYRCDYVCLWVPYLRNLVISYARLNLSLHILEDSWGDEESLALKVFVTKNPFKYNHSFLLHTLTLSNYRYHVTEKQLVCIVSQTCPNSLWDILISMFSSTNKRFPCCNPNIRKAAIANFAPGRFFANKS